MGFVDFSEVKARVSIERAMELLGLQMTGKGAQYRGACPVCKSSDRGLVITPAKNLFYCFSGQLGGDQIALAAHIRGCKANEAAAFLMEHVQTPDTGTVRKNRASEQPQNQKARLTCPVLDYLEPDHPAVEAVGFDAETAKALGVGYAPRGTMSGLVLVPVRLEDGTLTGYIGITEAKLPKKFFLESNVVAFPKQTA